MLVETTARSEQEEPSPVEEIERRLAQQALIADFGRFALKCQDLDGILNEACRIAADGLQVRLAKVLRHLSNEDAFLLQAGIGWKAGLIGTAKIGADLESPAGYALKTGEPVISNHLAEEQRFRTPKLLADHGAVRAVNVVITGEGKPYGVLEADSRQLGAFSPHDINFLQALANTLGVAIDKERTHAQLESLLKQKELLLLEIDHRVKNSLSLVSGLLGMQERSAKSSEARVALSAASARILSIARIHEQLYRGTDTATVAFGAYLEGLCTDLAASLGRIEDIDFKVEAEAFDLPVSRAAPLGLITAELLTNALKYARHASARSSVVVTCARDHDHLVMTIADDGPGLPDGFDITAGNGLGMRVVTSLVRQLKGTVEAGNHQGGAHFVVRVAVADRPDELA